MICCILQFITGILVLFFSLVALAPFSDAATNLALGKSYSISTPPNYKYTAPATDKTSLTDGTYSVGPFWRQKTTVGWGWLKEKTIEIMIDLERSSIIDNIVISTVRGENAEVYYPPHVAAFVGIDKDHFFYVGDVVDTPDNRPGFYETRRFSLSGIGAKGRFVLLQVILPKSRSYFFCDEIEVLDGNEEKGIYGRLTLEETRSLVEEMRRLDIDKELLQSLAAQLDSAATAAGPETSDRLVQIKQAINELHERHTAAMIEVDLLGLRCEILSSLFPDKQVLVEEVAPWAPLSPLQSPTGVVPKDLSLLMPREGYDYSALMITNLSQQPRSIALSLAVQAAGAPQLSLYRAAFVQSASIDYVADPLLPISEEFSLRSGESAMVMIAAQGKESGAWQMALMVKSENFNESVQITVRTTATSLPNSLSLNSVNWGYLTFKTIKFRQERAITDLLAHHTNVVVVPPEYLPGANQKGAIDFIPLERYLHQQKDAAKLLLFLGFGGSNRTTVIGKNPFMSDRWQQEFKSWYSKLKCVLESIGYSEERIFLYPYDEIEGRQADDFVKLAAWAKKEIPTIKFYATVCQKDVLEKILSLADIVQISAIAPGFSRSSQPKDAEIWLYDAKGPAKSLSPYAYYRLMSWKAYVNGYTGVGFWSYADAGSGDEAGTAWDDFDGINPDYAVIYEGEGEEIISSRRWEAWRVGIEDYELLTMYAKTKGEAVARDLAASVLNHPEDISKANEARRKILIELSSMEKN
jgi:hypothetical protein